MFVLLLAVIIITYYVGTGVSLGYFKTKSKYKKWAIPLAFIWFISLPVITFVRMMKK